MTAVEVHQENGTVDSRAAGFARLREPIESTMVGKLPKPTKKDAKKGKCKPAAEGGEAPGWQDHFCGGWHGLPAVHLDYAGHAAVTSRLLEVDPEWGWEPKAGWDENGEPRFVRVNNKPVRLWIELTVLGVTRPGVGTVDAGVFDAEKQLIGDALRNAAMRFGVALDLWIKGSDEENVTKVEPVVATWAGINEAQAKEMGWASLDEAGQEHDDYITTAKELNPAQQQILKARKTKLGIGWPMTRDELDTVAKLLSETVGQRVEPDGLPTDPEFHDTNPEDLAPTVQQRHERLTPRQRSKVNAAAAGALLSPMAPDLSSADVVGWEMVLDEHEASRPPPFPDPDETGVPGNSNEAS